MVVDQQVNSQLLPLQPVELKLFDEKRMESLVTTTFSVLDLEAITPRYAGRGLNDSNT